MKIDIFCTATFSPWAFTANGRKKVMDDFENRNADPFRGGNNQTSVISRPATDRHGNNSQQPAGKKISDTWKAFVISFDSIDISKNPLISFQFCSPVKAAISGRLEAGNEGETIDFKLDVTETDQWINYTADLSALFRSAKTFIQASFFINPKNEADTSRYYWNDLIITQKRTEI